MKWIVGIDEVGRGPLAGPVMVGAVAIPVSLYKKMKWEIGRVALTDSKLMSERNREIWYKQLQYLHKEKKIRVAVVSASAKAIDTKGISTCIASCVAKGLQKIGIDPKDCTVYLDGGLRAPVVYKKQQAFIKGDRIHKIISAASVYAKVTRDRLMVRMDTQHPYYAWKDNKGYGTTVHRTAIKKRGITALHRTTFLQRIISVKR